MALLHLLMELAPRWALQLTVLHLDHGLRAAESSQDAEFVSGLAARMDLPLILSRVDVRQQAQDSGENLEQAGRRARQTFYTRHLSSGALDRVAVGHTRSDQAETVLFRLMRGSGATGLAGIWPVTREGIVRPLLGVGRGDVLAWLRSRGLAWREDSSNRDLRFSRNRIRHQLLPELRKWNPAIVETLANLAAASQAEEQHWEQVTDRLAAERLRVGAEGVLTQAAEWQQLSLAEARRLARRAVQLAKGDLLRVDFKHIEEMLKLLRLPGGSGKLSIPGIRIERSMGWVRLATPPEAEEGSVEYQFRLEAPGSRCIPWLGTEIRLERLVRAEDPGSEPGGASGYNTNRIHDLDWAALTEPLTLRNWRAGDQFRPAGRSTFRKIKDWLQRKRVPAWDRPGWPVIVSKGHIVWMGRFGAADGYAAADTTPEILRIREI